MRYLRMSLLALSIVLALGGCAAGNEVENHVYALVMGLDLTEGDEIELSIRFPRASQSDSGDASSGDSDEAYPLMSARGANYDRALERLQWLVSRELNLSQLKLLIVSERLACSPRFPGMIDAIAQTRHLYTTAAFVVCEGDAKTFMKGQRTHQGIRLSNDIAAMFRHLAAHAYIPKATFAELYYGLHAYGSDALAIWGLALAEEDAESVNAASATLSGMAESVRTGVSGQAGRHYLGSAVLRDGRMVCRLDARETLSQSLLSGRVKSFSFDCDGRAWPLSTTAAPRIRIALKGGQARIEAAVRLCSEVHVPADTLTGLRTAVSEALEGVVRTCQRRNVEPFGFAAVAAGHFATLDAWRACDWRTVFPGADINVTVDIANLEA